MLSIVESDSKNENDDVVELSSSIDPSQTTYFNASRLRLIIIDVLLIRYTIR